LDKFVVDVNLLRERLEIPIVNIDDVLEDADKNFALLSNRLSLKYGTSRIGNVVIRGRFMAPVLRFASLLVPSDYTHVNRALFADKWEQARLAFHATYREKGWITVYRQGGQIFRMDAPLEATLLTNIENQVYMQDDPYDQFVQQLQQRILYETSKPCTHHGVPAMQIKCNNFGEMVGSVVLRRQGRTSLFIVKLPLDNSAKPTEQQLQRCMGALADIIDRKDIAIYVNQAQALNHPDCRKIERDAQAEIDAIDDALDRYIILYDMRYYPDHPRELARTF
jgi:hypothetical protein